MTNLERDTRKMFIDFVTDATGATELNSIIGVKRYGETLTIRLEDGTVKILTIQATEVDE